MDFQLQDGKKITFDLYKMTYGQYKGLFDPNESDEASDETIARVSGLTVDEMNNLPFPDRKGLIKAFFAKCREPLKDPNSESVPT